MSSVSVAQVTRDFLSRHFAEILSPKWPIFLRVACLAGHNVSVPPVTRHCGCHIPGCIAAKIRLSKTASKHPLAYETDKSTASFWMPPQEMHKTTCYYAWKMVLRSLLADFNYQLWAWFSLAWAQELHHDQTIRSGTQLHAKIKAVAEVSHAMAVDQQNHFTWWWCHGWWAEWLWVPVGTGCGPCFINFVTNTHSGYSVVLVA